LLLPFSALQILWINFLGDGPPALAIALDSSKHALREPPREPSAPLLDARAARFVLADGLLKGGIGLSLLLLLPALGASTAASASAVFLYEGVAKLLSMFPARRLMGELRPNRWVVGATALSMALQLSCVAVPAVRQLLGLVALSSLQLAIVVAALSATFLVGEVILRALRPNQIHAAKAVTT
jgi:Ca2+-transporting ATPase